MFDQPHISFSISFKRHIRVSQSQARHFRFGCVEVVKPNGQGSMPEAVLGRSGISHDVSFNDVFRLR